ncbi:MAG: Rpp14/Pop5 family protein [Candidatus Nezhaarchaeales archaeon]
MKVKDRWRYLLVCIHVGGAGVTREALCSAIINGLHSLYGDWGLSRSKLLFFDYNPKKSLLVLRCAHKSILMVRAAIAMVYNIEGGKALLHVKKITGTLKKARKILEENN